MAKTASPPAGYGISPRAASEPPEGVLRDAALLLADTPEVAVYFETHGDMAGRELRHRCQARIARTVTAHGGKMARTTGDTAWVYFTEPGDALSAAVALQERFRDASPEGDRIGVRVGLHFGEVILERQELMGHMVHQLERLVQSIAPGQIAVTRAFRDSRWRRDPPPLPLQPLAVGDGLESFLAQWDAGKSTDPAGTVQLRLVPLWSLAISEFSAAWEALVSVRDRLRSSRPVTSAVMSDGSLRFLLDDAGTAARLGEAAVDYLADRMGPAAGGLIPIWATVDRAGGNALADAERMPGAVYLTPEAAGEAPSLPVTQESPSAKAPPILRYTPDLASETPPAFRLAPALGAGAGTPCFYCGARRHHPSRCPTRRAEGRADALDRLGYLAPEEMNRLFLRFLTGGNEPLADGTPPRLAGEAFGALKRVHQLGFFRQLWATRADRWADVDDPRFQDRRSRGGRAWLAMDCLKNGRWDEAEKMLSAAIKAAPSDPRIHAGFGFLALEREDRSAADFHFDQARYHARSGPETVFALLQRYRLALLDGRMLDAEKFLEQARLAAPDCPPAAYEAAVFQLRRGHLERGFKALLDLAEGDRRFYLHLLLDPDLALWSGRVQEGLGHLYRSARNAAAHWMPQATQSVARARERLGADDRVVVELSAHLSRLSALQERGGYFGLLDAAEGAGSLVARADRAVRLRREGLFDLLQREERRCEALAAQLTDAKPGPLVNRLRADVETLRSDIDGIRNGLRDDASEPLHAVGEQLEAVAIQLNRAEFRFRLWGTLRQGMRFMGTFFRVSLVLQSINLVIGLLLIPLTIRLLALFVEGWQVPLPYLRLSQMGTLVVGGLIAFLIAAFRGLQKMEPD